MTLINYHTFGDRAGSFGLAPKKRGLNGSLSSSEGKETTPSGWLAVALSRSRAHQLTLII